MARLFVGLSALLFVGSAAVTVSLGTSMSAMGGMPMLWMRMPGQTWLGAAASFLGMWDVMMVAMMLPSLVPVLWRYRQLGVASGSPHADGLTAVVGLSYFVMWTVLGVPVFALGAALAAIGMRATPIAVGAVLVAAGLYQRSPWKARALAACRDVPRRRQGGSTAVGAAWRHGLRLGIDCARGCANLMAILLVVGMMDLRAMAAVAIVSAAERLVPAGGRVVRLTGLVAVGVGLLLVASTA